MQKKTNNPRRTESQGSDCGGYFDDTHYKLRGKERARFVRMLEDLLSAVPDTLTADEVVEVTGYHRRTVLRYVQRKYIYAVTIMGKYYISNATEYDFTIEKGANIALIVILIILGVGAITAGAFFYFKKKNSI